MKIEVLIYNEQGKAVAKAIEPTCNSLIVNGMHVISNGNVTEDMSDMLGVNTQEDIGMTLVPPLELN